MLKIWGRKTSSNVRKVLWCLAELDLEFDRVNIGGPFGGNDDAKYRAINPNGLVPTLEDDDTVVWESNTIIRYLSAIHGKGTLWPEDPAKRAVADMWMDWQIFSLIPNVGFIFRETTRKVEAEWDQDAIVAAKVEAIRYMKILDSYLAEKCFIAGDNLTMGDLPIGFFVNRWKLLDPEHPALENLDAWHHRLKARPGFNRHITNGGL
jgi:glutathione S-transferase